MVGLIWLPDCWREKLLKWRVGAEETERSFFPLVGRPPANERVLLHAFFPKKEVSVCLLQIKKNEAKELTNFSQCTAVW